MEIIFPYREERSKLIGTIYRPVALVELKSEFGWIPEWMYVDSGADISLLPRSLGDLLGFKVTQDIQEIRGVGESVVPVIIRNIDVRLGEEVFNARVAWSLIEEVPPLLGRIDMFDKFEVTFKQHEKKVVFMGD
jgi:hypothetical protein